MKKVHLMMLVWILGGALAAGCDDKKEEETQEPAPCVGEDCPSEACSADNCNGVCKDGVCVEACTGDSCDEPKACSAETCPNGDCVDGECVPHFSGCDASNCAGKCINGECVIPKCDAPDEDNDGISDEDEGRASGRDSDKDGTPDYLDDDSDGDTIPDSVEGANDGCSRNKPVDSDSDGSPDFIDTDSDENGILDKDEVGPDPKNPVDTDGDTVPDYRDDDNDGDGFSDNLEIFGELMSGVSLPDGKISADCDGDGEADDMGSVEKPRDCDKDGVADYLDVDSDGDKLLDSYEGSMHAGQWFARYTKDGDGNGVSDTEECKGKPDDAGYMSSCVDTDGDTIPDFLDHDNDGDSLSDVYEIGKGYDYNSADGDGDGADDLIEIGAGTDPMDPKVNPQSEGNFVFKVPYKKKTEPEKQSMSLATSVQMVDIYFAIDTSDSMKQEIATLKTELPAMLDMMRCRDLDKDCADNSDCRGLNDGKAICSVAGRCIVDPNTVTAKNEEGKDEIVGCFVDMWTGFGVWGNLNTFQNWQSLDADPAKTTAALNAVNLGSQGDYENSVQVGACVSEGITYCTNEEKIRCYAGDDRVGCVGYRPEAIKILIQAGDERNYEVTTETKQWSYYNASKTGESLRKNNIRYIGLYGTPESRDKGLSQVACWAGSCAAGENCALTCQNMTKDEKAGLYLAEIDDEDIKEKTVSIVRKLAKGMNLHITTEVEDVDENAAKLIQALRVNVTDDVVQGRSCTKVQGISDESFPSIEKIAPGTSICFDVIPVDNQELFPPTEEPQIVKAKVKIMGDGSMLNSGIAYFLIPPEVHEEHIN